MKYSLILFIVFIAVMFVGCDARPSAPVQPVTYDPSDQFDLVERYLQDGTHCVILVPRHNMNSDIRFDCVKETRKPK